MERRLPREDAALTLMGDAKAGEDTYQTYCAACHLPSGGGNPDGGIPQLAGQHRTVLIKQLADIRAGVRDNPAMYPFAIELPDAQALADVATYIETLCIPRGAGQYEAPDAAEQIAYGKRLFEKECSLCHGLSGDGMQEKFYPVLAGQHYAYLLRQLADIRAGKRGNAHPDDGPADRKIRQCATGRPLGVSGEPGHAATRMGHAAALLRTGMI
jgi:cytochrome c553